MTLFPGPEEGTGLQGRPKGERVEEGPENVDPQSRPSRPRDTPSPFLYSGVLELKLKSVVGVYFLKWFTGGQVSRVQKNDLSTL